MTRAGPGDPFEHAWAEVEAKWGDDAAHRKFIAFCAAQGALSEAGRRYRTVRDGDPARSDEAKKRIDAVLGAALQTMELTRTDKTQKSQRTSWLAVGMILFVVAYAVLSILRARSR